MTSNIDTTKPSSFDKSNPAPEIRKNFSTAADEISRLQYLAFDTGPAESYTAPGDDTGIVPLNATRVTLTSSGAGASDDVAMPDGVYHGHQMLITLGTLAETGDSVVLKPTSSNILKSDGSTAATSVTLDAADEYALLIWNKAAGKWTIMTASGTVA